MPGCRVAKAVLVKTGDSFAIAVLACTRRIDLRKLSDVVGCPTAQIRLATDDELAEVLPIASRERAPARPALRFANAG